MNGIVIISLLVVLSGLISYLGDQIGMKVGKKRISLFGLRPRHSSIIITIITGILIAVLSLAILLGTYTSLRQALLNINEVLDRLETLNVTLEEKDRELTEKDRELNDMKQEIDDKSEELVRLQNQRNNLEQELQSTRSEYMEAARNLQEARAELESTKSELQQTRGELKQTEANLSQARKDIEELEASRDELQQRVAGLQEQRQQLENKIEELDKRIDELTKNYEEARKLATQYQQNMYYYMGGDIVYQKGDVVYSGVIEGGKSEQEIIKDVKSFLEEANKVARQKPVQVDEETGMTLRLRSEDIYNVARIIYNMEEDKKVIVNLVARVNVPKNDWLYADFLLNENFIVYEKGELIATRKIDADRLPHQIEEELQALLNTVNENAIDKGLLPDTQGKVGSINFSQFYELLNEIKDMESKIRVKVYAAEDIWRQVRLSTNLEFAIEKIEGEKIEGKEDEVTGEDINNDKQNEKQDGKGVEKGEIFP